MIRRYTKRKSILGIDIGQTAIKAVQVAQAGDDILIEGAVKIARPDKRSECLTLDEAMELRDTLERRAMHATHTILVAPSGGLVGSALDVPKAKDAVTRQRLVQSELGRAHRLQPGTFEFAWWDLPANASGVGLGQVHAVALPHQCVMPTIDALTSISRDTTRTIPQSLACLRVAQHSKVDPLQISAVLDIGSNSAHLTLYYANTAVHERRLPDFDLKKMQHAFAGSVRTQMATPADAMSYFGIRDETEGPLASATASLLENAAGELAQEIALSFAYISHRYPQAELGPMFLVGGGANVPGLVGRLGADLELQALCIAPDSLGRIDCFGAEAGDSAMTTAFAAALWGGGQ